MTDDIRTVLIVGYGVMGRGVAATFARSGFKTLVKSRRAGDLADLPPGVVATGTFPAMPPDLVIELAPEDIAVKQMVYAEVEATYADADVIIATGTSGLDLERLGERLRKPQNFVGLHYFMPAETSLVVEVMAGPGAPAALVDKVARAIERTGKEPVRLYRPTVGFLVNRLQHAILHEAYYLIEAGVATAAEIDHAARRLLAPRMCITGLIEQKDISGLQVHGQAQCSIVPALYHNGTPSPMLQDMLAREESGLAAGQGFYDWTRCEVNEVRASASRRLNALLGHLDANPGVPAVTPRARSTAELLGHESRVNPSEAHQQLGKR